MFRLKLFSFKNHKNRNKVKYFTINLILKSYKIYITIRNMLHIIIMCTVKWLIKFTSQNT